MEDEREDGEISEEESNACEDVNVYNPIARPVSNLFDRRNVCSSIPSSDDESSSSDSDSDSESEFVCKPKRQKTKNVQMEIERNGQQEQPFGKRKQNNIWSNVLQEEELLVIGGVGLKKLKGDRNVESYDYTRALKTYENKEEDAFEFEETEEDVQKRLVRKRRFCDNFSDENKKKGKKQSGPRYLQDINLDTEWDSEYLGNIIANALHEQKPELIVRVVQVLGHEKALELYKSTQKLEKEGGMMINSGSRRRTSGGLFLLLMKTFDGVTNDHLSKIFIEDQEDQQLWRKRMRANRRRQKYKDKLLGADCGETEDKVEEDGLHLKGLFSDDPGGTKCPGSTPVTSPTTSDNEDSENSSPSKMKGNQTLLHLKEVCEKAASEIIFRDKSEEVELGEIPSTRQDDMETC